MVRVLFPSLFNNGVEAVNYSDIVVKRSPINANCVIVKARQPIEFLMSVAAQKELSACWVDAVCIRSNTDGSVSVWDLN
jgi:hypothetical protein